MSKQQRRVQALTFVFVSVLSLADGASDLASVRDAQRVLREYELTFAGGRSRREGQLEEWSRAR